MASSTLVKDLLHRVSVQLHDTDPQFQRWTQRELVDALNDAQRAIAKFLPSSCARVVSVRLAPGTRQNLALIPAARLLVDGVAPAGDIHADAIQSVVRNMGADGVTPGRAIRLVDRSTLDAMQPDWHTRSAAVVQGWVFDPKTPRECYVTPGAPAAPASWVEMSLLVQPAEITSSGDLTVGGGSQVVISVDDKHVDDLMFYILSRANEKDSEFAESSQAQSYAAMFASSINAQAAALTGVNPNLRGLPNAPATPRPGA